jgi:taurine--2-oxoglutarate transaminase
MYTGRNKIAVRYRSYHGGTAAAISMTGDPRRWAAEPGIPGVIRIPDTHRWGQPEPDEVGDLLQRTEDVIMYEGPKTVAAIVIETVVGTNGILVPPDGYLAGLRDICDRHGILLVADEVMAGFGRTGKWFAVDHWGVVPDLIAMAKGLSSAYVQLGALGMRHHIAEHFRDNVFYGGLTYNSHPLACATALAAIDVIEEDGLIERAARMGEVLRGHMQRMRDKHPSVGAIRSIGLFGLIELVRQREPYTPIAPYNGTSDEMAALGRHFRQEGLYTFVRWNYFFTNPPLTISEDELAHGFDIIDRGLDITDEAARA